MTTNKWVVIGKDMDGITGYAAVHSTDVAEYRSGCYWGGIAQGLSMHKAEIQKLADELNAKNEPAPENPFRGLTK
jgi:hypothetical protein